MNHNCPFYIDRHPCEVLLDGEWQFAYTDEVSDNPSELDYPNTATLPASTYRCLERAGILPDPYYGTNSKLYEWVDKKTWYFKRSFALGETEGKEVFLCFDGVGYYSRVWLNGRLLTSHEGMFGGPIVEIGEYLKVGENELVVESVAPDQGYGCIPTQEFPEGNRRREQIVPWNLCRDNETSNGDFILFGIWRSVRLEIVPKTHLSRPYLYTKSIDGDSAKLRLSVELADEQILETDEVLNNPTELRHYHSNAYEWGLAAFPTGKQVRVKTTVTEKESGSLAYLSEETVDILNKEYVCKNAAYRECQFFETDIEIKNPRLWWPTQLGKPELYTVVLELYDGDKLIDMLSFNTGIRTVEYIPTAGMRHRTRWDDYHFVINGRPIFLKGMNWLPLDFLLDVTDGDYRWALEMTKNLGVQLIRVWNGGGVPEDDRFYDMCDEMGIMVMQDCFIENRMSDGWNRVVLQSQLTQNVYRIRNHPSLALYNGGNEFNAYATDNDAAMWVTYREVADLDPSRKFWRTTPDKGSAHIYRDMEPVWYRKIYGELPFVGESGIHSFPNAKSIRQVISEREYEAPLHNIFSEEFRVTNPELINHFTEFNPERIPRMLSRASMINDIHGITLADLCEATQMASSELYQIMIQAMRENYPRTVGILPWCLKRPWTTTACQLVDGLGEPVAPYYFVKNAYSPLLVEIALKEVTYCAGEELVPDLRVIYDGLDPLNGITVGAEIYSPSLECVYKAEFVADISKEEYMKRYTGAPFVIPESFNDSYFFIRTYAVGGGKELYSGAYWCKVLSTMKEPEYRAECRREPKENTVFDKGPWLKPQLLALPKCDSELTLLSRSIKKTSEGLRVSLKLKIENRGSTPVFPVKLEIAENKTVSYATDNYFFLKEGGVSLVDIEVWVKDETLHSITVNATAWNMNGKSVRVDI